jgi:hypothetical protein
MTLTSSTCIKERLILWLLCGEGKELNNDDPTLVVAKYSAVTRRMRVRAALKFNLAPDILNIATGRELMDNGPNDAILGHRLFVKDGLKFNGLTFDHIIPISIVKNDLDAFSINNIQPISKYLNNIKGICHDCELIFWLNTLRGCYSDRYRP